MTYGRPSMTSQISPVPFPAMGAESRSDDPCERTGQPCDHKLGYMTFYVSTIELYKILESILSDIYNAWQSRSTNTRAVAGRSTRHNSLDVIMELEDKLSAYETSVPEMINWTREHRPSNTDSHRLSIFRRQRNVLHARYEGSSFCWVAVCSFRQDSFIFVSSSIGQCSLNYVPTSATAQPAALVQKTASKPHFLAARRTSYIPLCPPNVQPPASQQQ